MTEPNQILTKPQLQQLSDEEFWKVYWNKYILDRHKNKEYINLIIEENYRRREIEKQLKIKEFKDNGHLPIITDDGDIQPYHAEDYAKLMKPTLLKQLHDDPPKIPSDDIKGFIGLNHCIYAVTQCLEFNNSTVLVLTAIPVKDIETLSHPDNIRQVLMSELKDDVFIWNGVIYKILSQNDNLHYDPRHNNIIIIADKHEQPN